MNQMFVKCHEGEIAVILTKLTDDLLLAGDVKGLKEFGEVLQDRF